MTSAAYFSGSVQDGVLVLSVLVEKLRDPETAYSLRDEVISQVDASGTKDLVLDLQQVQSPSNSPHCSQRGGRSHCVPSNSLIPSSTNR